MWSRYALAALVGVSTTFAACGLFPSVEGFTDNAGGPSADASVDAALVDGDALAVDGPVANDGAVGDGGADACTEGPCCSIPSRGPTMVRVGAFCIDSTEVTQSQYAAFLADVGTTPKAQPAECAFKTSLAPQTFGGCLYEPTNYPNHPVNCVDWCDAVAFCAWSGKRLCGGIEGGPVPDANYAGANASQWTFACTNGGKRDYPYGPSYDGTKACNGGDASLAGPPSIVAVGSRTDCVGGFAGISDMSGNVWEWIDACRSCGDGGRCCARMGGAYNNSESNLSCVPSNSGVAFPTIDERDIGHGFRCCSP